MDTARVAVFALTMAAATVVTVAVLHPADLVAVEDDASAANPSPALMDRLLFTVSIPDPPKNGDTLTFRVQAENITNKSATCEYTALLVLTKDVSHNSRMHTMSEQVSRQAQTVTVAPRSTEVVELTFKRQLFAGLYDVRLVRTADAAKQLKRAPRNIPDEAVTVASFTIKPA